MWSSTGICSWLWKAIAVLSDQKLFQSVLGALYAVHTALYTVHRTLYVVLVALYVVFSALYAVLVELLLPYIFCQLHSKRPYNKKNITRQLKDMDFMFSWQEQYLTRSLRSLVRYCSCHSNIKSISSRNRVISSIYAVLTALYAEVTALCSASITRSTYSIIRSAYSIIRGASKILHGA